MPTKKKPAWKSQSEIADICGVSKQAIQKQCRTKFKDALNEKGEINRWHTAVIAYKELQDEKRKQAVDPLVKPQKSKEAPQIKSIPINGSGEEISLDEISNLTLKQIVDKWGGIAGFRPYVDAMAKMTDWKIKDQKYRADRKELIEKEPTAAALFSIINVMLTRIVNDYPNIITDRLIAKARSSKKNARIEVVELQQQTLSEIIKAAKKELVAELKKIDE